MGVFWKLLHAFTEACPYDSLKNFYPFILIGSMDKKDKVIAPEFAKYKVKDIFAGLVR